MWEILLIVSLSSCVVYNVAAESCPAGQPIRHFNIQNEPNPSVFDDLTMDEITAVYAYMRGVEEFNILDGRDVVPNGTYVYLIERLQPGKAEVLQYLDHSGIKPPRFASVILFRGDATPPVVEEYKVGPLPTIQGHELILCPGGHKSIDYAERNMFSLVEVLSLDGVVVREVTKVDHILEKVLGYTMSNCGNKCLTWSPVFLGRYKAGDHGIWIIIYRQHEGYYVHPNGLEFRIDTKNNDLDVGNWEIDYVWMQGQIFTSFEDMSEKYVAPSNPDPPQYRDTDKNLYSSLHQRGDPVPEQEQRGPRSFMPDGRRYSVDGHHIQWQGWTFDFNIRTTTSLQLHDIRFKGERIAYELSPSEIGIMYTGETPATKHTFFLDSSLLFGIKTQRLFPLMDCPDHATYFDFAHFIHSRASKFVRSACVFEHSSSVPLRRHLEADLITGEYKFAHGMPGNVLILRAILTVANYEYILDYTFHQNGVLEVVVSLDGYILSTYRTGNVDNRYGYELHSNITGHIHNHLAHFKVDLDVLGTSNRFETLDIKVKNIEDPTDPGTMINIHTVEKNPRKTEKNATYKFNFETPKYLIFQNAAKNNSVGNPRSYRLLVQGMGKQLIPEGWAMEPGFSWTRYQVAVTKQKDNETRGSSIYNLGNMFDPPVNFQHFIDDNESIVDQDLVAWIGLSAFHIPHSEDLPIVQTPGLSLKFLLLPYNFFNEDPSLASRDNMRFSPKRGGGVDYTGAKARVDCNPYMVRDASKVTSASSAQPTHATTYLYILMGLVFLCNFLK